jgi:hypothetical protein
MKQFVDKVQDLDAISGGCMKGFSFMNIRRKTFPNP